MRVLVDECAPRALKQFLAKQGHRCLTVQEAWWSGKQNGELLAAAEPEFDVLITVDTNIRYQQNMEGRSIAHRGPPFFFQSPRTPPPTLSRLRSGRRENQAW